MGTPLTSADLAAMAAALAPTLTEDDKATLDAEIRRFVALRDRHKILSDLASTAKDELDDQKDRLFLMMEDQGIKTVNHDLGRITRTETVSGIVSDAKAAREYFAEASQLDEMTRTEWHKANLNRFVKTLIESGEELPPGVGSMTKTNITFTAAPQQP